MIYSFANAGKLSLIDIMSMGDSDKKNNVNKIGKFDSGLKYALCILTRLKVPVIIISDRKEYTFYTKTLSDGNKSKEVLAFDCLDLDTETTKQTVTGFAINLGSYWEDWMAIREIYSNCLDEQGEFSIFTNDDEYYKWFDNFKMINNKTIITIFDSKNVFKNVQEEWDKYFLNSKPIFKPKEELSISVYENPYKELLIYKNGILIYRDENKFSSYRYSYDNAEIDEMRQLSNHWSLEYDLARYFQTLKDKKDILKFIDEYQKDSYEANNLDFRSYDFSEEFITTINNLSYEESSSLKTYPSLWKALTTNVKINLKTRNVLAHSSIYERRVEINLKDDNNSNVKEVNLFENKELTFDEYIKDICKSLNYIVEYPIVKSDITGYKAIGDRSRQIIYCSEEFTKDDLWEIIKAQCRLKSQDSDFIYKEYQKLLNNE